MGIFLDALDGNLARKLQTESKLGEKLDSKADFITFGVAPAIVIYRTVQPAWAHHGVWIALAASLLYYFSVHYRLNRFTKGGGGIGPILRGCRLQPAQF